MDIYLYLVQNKLHTSKAAIRKVETLAEQYILLDSLLFKIISEKETVVLAVAELYADKVITLYHSSLFAGHQGVIKVSLKLVKSSLSQILYIISGPTLKGVISVN